MSKLVKADAELAEFFTSAIGIHAQGYEPNSGVGFDPRRADDSLVHQITRGTLGAFDAIASTIAQTPSRERRILALVYTPHARPTWLASVLSPRWGSGSYVELASALPTAAAAVERRHPGSDTSQPAVLGFFMGQGRGSADKLFRQLANECEALRDSALRIYEELRVVRVDLEERVRAAQAEKRRVRNEAMLDAMMGRNAARGTLSYNRRLRTAS